MNNVTEQLSQQQQLSETVSSIVAVCQQAAQRSPTHHASDPAALSSVQQRNVFNADPGQPHSVAEKCIPAKGGINSTNSSSREPAAGSCGGGDEKNEVPPMKFASSQLLGKWREVTCRWSGKAMSRVFMEHMVEHRLSSWGLLCPWEESYPDETMYTLLRKLPAKQGSDIWTGIYRACQYALLRPMAVPMLQIAHEELSTKDGITEFKAHVGMAVKRVLELYFEGDWDALELIMAREPVSFMAEFHYEQTEDMEVTNVSVDIWKVDIVSFHAMNAEQLTDFYSPYELKDQLAMDNSNIESADKAMWDIVHVYVEAQWQASLRMYEMHMVSKGYLCPSVVIGCSVEVQYRLSKSYVLMLICPGPL